jgi:predicted kinase
MMCGLPASGKTTTATRLQARRGGVLIRSCDIYQELGIALPAWVKRTAGFTSNVWEYDRVRDRAYAEMARRADLSLANGSPFVVIDAVHGERAKRQPLYEICAARDATPILVVCTCDDFTETRRRFQAREGHEAEPEREASDLAVFRDIRRRWESPFEDQLPDGTRPAILIHDTLTGGVARIRRRRDS